jgi:exopolysaccharide biosynthesis polyprenyl glycosylphosphotransferase
LLRRFSTNFALFSIAVDLLLVAGSLRLAVVLRPALSVLSFIEPMPAPVSVPWVLFLLFPLLSVVILSTFSIYDARKYLRIVDEFSALTAAFLVASVSLAGVLYFSFRDVSRALFVLFMFLAYTGLLSWRAVARFYFRMRKDWPDIDRSILIVGVGPLGQRVWAQIEAGQVENLTLIGFVDDDASISDNPQHILGGYKDVGRLVSARRVTDVVIALPHSAYQHMAEIVTQLESAPVRVWVALGFFDLALYNTAIEDLAGIPMLDLSASALNDIQRLAKRAFDLCLGMLFLLVAAPLMGLIILLIRLEDGPPAIFRQSRVGEGGRLFNMYKFRTMVRNAEQLRSEVETVAPDGTLVHKSPNDPRVTRLGRFLRRTSLDELPQLFNVLQGSMSLVGPRPEMPFLVEHYQPWQRKRFAVPPGITGWWQVTGRSEKLMHLHTEDDLFYINNYSIWLDIQILIRTAWVVVIGKGSY